MKRFNTQAIVLKKMNIGDKDRIYTFLTKDKGKVSALAKGVRAITSRRSGSLDSINNVSIKITERENTSLNTLDEAVVLDSFKNIKKDLNASVDAYYISELVLKNVEEDLYSPDIYVTMLKSLHAMDKSPSMSDKITTYFELNFLKNLGYQINLEKCVVCGKVLDKFANLDKATFSLEAGGFNCPDHEMLGLPVDPKTLTYLREASNGKLASEVALQTLQQADNIVKASVRYHLEGKFKSLELKDL